MECREFKESVLKVFNKVFPLAEIKESERESWIEFTLYDEVYGVRFSDSLIWQSRELGMNYNIVAAEMLRKAVTHIAEESDK